MKRTSAKRHQIFYYPAQQGFTQMTEQMFLDNGTNDINSVNFLIYIEQQCKYSHDAFIKVIQI